MTYTRVVFESLSQYSIIQAFCKRIIKIIVPPAKDHLDIIISHDPNFSHHRIEYGVHDVYKSSKFLGKRHSNRFRDRAVDLSISLFRLELLELWSLVQLFVNLYIYSITTIG